MKRDYESTAGREPEEIFFGDATRDQVERYEKIAAWLSSRPSLDHSLFSKLIIKFREKYHLLNPEKKNVRQRSSAAERQARYKARQREKAFMAQENNSAHVSV